MRRAILFLPALAGRKAQSAQKNASRSKTAALPAGRRNEMPLIMSRFYLAERVARQRTRHRMPRAIRGLCDGARLDSDDSRGNHGVGAGAVG